MINTKVKAKKKTLASMCNSFINSKWAYLLLLILFTVAFINLIKFGFYDLEIRFPWLGDTQVTSSSDNAWLGWMQIVISMIGTISIVLSDILIIRFNRKFVWAVVIGCLATIINALLVGWFFTSFSYTFMLITGIYNYFKWGNEDNSQQMTFNTWTLVAVAFSFYVTFGLIITEKLQSAGVAGFEDGLNSLICVSDVICSGIVMASYIILLRKSKWGFLGFVITDIYYIFVWGAAGFFTNATMFAIYLFFIDSPAFLSWQKTN